MLIKQTTLDFLVQLNRNNNKNWFDTNRSNYEFIKKDTRKFFEQVFSQLKEIDDIEHMQIFRINRDIRFSKDKSPYKNHLSVQFRRRKPELRGGYYLHLEPGKSFLAGGFWSPEKEDTLRIRQEFEMDASNMREIMNNGAFKIHFNSICGDALATAPKGFDKNHADIDLIRMKNWYFEAYFSDKEILADNFAQTAVDRFALLLPFFNYMSDVLTTDLNGESILNQ